MKNLFKSVCRFFGLKVREKRKRKIGEIAQDMIRLAEEHRGITGDTIYRIVLDETKVKRNPI